jgi:hypothetical protein
MAFGLRRFSGRDNALRTLLESDSAAVSKALADAPEAEAPDDGDLDLKALLGRLFAAAPTDDVKSLEARGVDDERFWADEVRPNWDGLSQGERSAKVESFARFANVLGEDDPGGMGAVVRTKLLVLAWAYDRTYVDELLRQIARKPQRFGTLELSPVR